MPKPKRNTIYQIFSIFSGGKLGCVGAVIGFLVDGILSLFNLIFRRVQYSSPGIFIGRLGWTKVTIPHRDRLKHAHVMGATGSGKTTLLANMLKQDIAAYKKGEATYGIGVIDPKGDLIDRVLRYIPDGRVDDVIFFDPSDTEKPLGFNILEDVPENLRSLTASQVVTTFKKLFGKTSWGPRLEHILRFAVLTLMEIPGSTLLDIPTLLIDQDFRRGVLHHVTNPQVREFWESEYSLYARKTGVSSAISPILNKIGPWVAYPEVRNVIGQVQSSFNLRKVMDQKKIFLARLPEGLLGEDVRQILGALLITRFQLAAASRVDIPEHIRQPFLLYVDEFQNFVTEASEKIITEGRSFGLGFIVANQHPGQFRGQPGITDSLMGNVAATLFAYKEGNKHRLQYTRLQSASPTAEEPNSIQCKLLPPFPPFSDGKYIIKESRERYGRDRDWVERDINRRRSYQSDQENDDFFESEKI